MEHISISPMALTSGGSQDRICHECVMVEILHGLKEAICLKLCQHLHHDRHGN
jgi:hypothetical protein